MDLSTSIAQMATNMSQTSLQQNIGVSVLKKAMNSSADLAMNTVEMIDDVSPAKAFSGNIGAIFDARA